MNIEIQYDNPDGFDSKLAHYGSFRNVNNFIILKGKNHASFEEDCGYYGEKLVLKGNMPEWFKKEAEAALLAPTAVNQQKFKMEIVDDEPVIK